MGGYQMAKSLAEDPQVGMMLGGITAGMFGGTLTFSIPLGFSLIQGDARKSLSKGMLIGIGCIPVGSIAGGIDAWHCAFQGALEQYSCAVSDSSDRVGFCVHAGSAGKNHGNIWENY